MTTTQPQGAYLGDIHTPSPKAMGRPGRARLTAVPDAPNEGGVHVIPPAITTPPAQSGSPLPVPRGVPQPSEKPSAEQAIGPPLEVKRASGQPGWITLSGLDEARQATFDQLVAMQAQFDHLLRALVAGIIVIGANGLEMAVSDAEHLLRMQVRYAAQNVGRPLIPQQRRR